MKPITLRLPPLLGPGDAFHFATVSRIRNWSQFHDHRFLEVFWVIEGQGWEWINGSARPLSPRRIGLVRADDRHRFASETHSPLIYRNLAFELEAWRHLRKRYAPAVPDVFADRRLAPRRPRLSVEAIAQLEAAAVDAIAGRRDRFTRDHLLMTLVRLLHSTATEPPHAPAWLTRALADREVVRAGVKALVRACHRSPEHVARCCREAYGRTPTELVNQARLDHAAARLQHPDASVSDACYDAGFNNLGHFHALFKERFRTTPRRFREAPRAVVPPAE